MQDRRAAGETQLWTIVYIVALLRNVVAVSHRGDIKHDRSLRLFVRINWLVQLTTCETGYSVRTGISRDLFIYLEIGTNVSTQTQFISIIFGFLTGGILNADRLFIE